MLKTRNFNLTKKSISKEINSKIGISSSYIEIITDDLIISLKFLIKRKILSIKNFGTFKIIQKKERIGRNPKNNKTYTITPRKSLSFIMSKSISDKINKI
jgi:integration host factor subunit alpha